MAEFGSNSATFGSLTTAVVRGKVVKLNALWQSFIMYSASMNVPHYWTADQVKRLMDALVSHNRHRARAAALIMCRTCLRVSKVLELEWRDVDYTGDMATLLVRRSKTRKARTVRLHPELVQLFTNWPANRSPRDRVVALSN